MTHASQVFEKARTTSTVKKVAHNAQQNAYSHVPLNKAVERASSTIKWNASVLNFKPSITNKLNDTDLHAAKAAFFQLDVDHSGTIDKEELASLLRSLGSMPSADELDEIMAEVEQEAGGDNDGQMSLREFLTWYAKSLHMTREVGQREVLDVFLGAGGSVDGGVSKASVRAMLMEYFGIDVETDDPFDALSGNGTMSLDEFRELLSVTKS